MMGELFAKWKKAEQEMQRYKEQALMLREDLKRYRKNKCDGCVYEKQNQTRTICAECTGNLGNNDQWVYKKPL